MSVIMTMRLKADPDRFEEFAAANQGTLQGIAERATEHGAIGHRFYGSDSGEVILIDEWPDAESFQSFFEAERSQIEPVMQEVGVAGEPEITFWRKLETGDDIGWGA
jgi:hypothetical protein